MFKNVVWATDGSVHADRALEYAKQLVPADGGTLHVTHVVEKLVGARVAGQDAHLNEAELEAKIETQARAAEREGLHVQRHVAVGHGGEVARRIADEAADAEADVIVVGTRGHSAVVAAVIGSVTQRLLHVAGCPVLAVPPARDGSRRTEPAADLMAAPS
jgi:nucleotide-binding universal stress UspA family protein